MLGWSEREIEVQLNPNATYRYIGTCHVPGYGAIGHAFEASGCHDPYSVEYGAWLFVPDHDPADSEGERGGYYVDPDRDLQLHHISVAHLSDRERFAMDLRDDPHACGYYGDEG